MSAGRTTACSSARDRRDLGRSTLRRPRGRRTPPTTTLRPTWRFSPGYGDLPLETQGDFLRTVDAEKRLGVTLSPGGLCIPTKTVTAVIGLSDSPVSKGKRGCAICRMAKTCQFRKKGEHCQ